MEPRGLVQELLVSALGGFLCIATRIKYAVWIVYFTEDR